MPGGDSPGSAWPAKRPRCHRQPRHSSSTRRRQTSACACAWRALREPSGEKARGENPGSAQMMIERQQAVVEAEPAVGRLAVPGRATRQPRLDPVLQVIPPPAEAAAQGKRQVKFLQRFEPRRQRAQHPPRIAKRSLPLARTVTYLALRTEAAEDEEGADAEIRVPPLPALVRCAAQPDQTRFPAQQGGNDFRCRTSGHFLDERGHSYT
jgi:hypothetical protein